MDHFNHHCIVGHDAARLCTAQCRAIPCRTCTYFVDDFDYFHWRKCLITVRIQNFKDLFLSLISMLDVEFDFFNWILSKQVL